MVFKHWRISSVKLRNLRKVKLVTMVQLSARQGAGVQAKQGVPGWGSSWLVLHFH